MDRLDRGNTVCDRAAENVIDVALAANVLKMLVVRAEHHAPGGKPVLCNLAHDLFNAAVRGADTQMNPHAGAELFQHLVIV